MLRELMEQKQTAWKSMRDMNDKTEAEKRNFTAEEQVQWDKLNKEVDGLGSRIDRAVKLQEEERSNAEAALAKEKTAMPQGKLNPAELRMLGFRSYLLTGQIFGSGADEFRALQADADIAGGFLVPPQEFVAQLIKAVDDAVLIRQLATKIQAVSSQSLGIPSLDADPADADWTVELAIGGEDSTMAIGKRELTPHPLAKRLLVSNKLLRISAIPAEALVRDRLAYKFGITEEKAFLSGNGVGQPLGVFVASANGIPTSRDVSTGNTTAEMRFDGLINAKYSLKAAYWPRARWIFHRDGAKQIRLLKDGEGRYLWEESVVAGQPASILGVPASVSEYAPNTFTTGLYVGIIGDFANYWIADALNMQLQRLVELYAATNQVGFIGRMELDGMPVLAEAFARVKLA